MLPDKGNRCVAENLFQLKREYLWLYEDGVLQSSIQWLQISRFGALEPRWSKNS